MAPMNHPSPSLTYSALATVLLFASLMIIAPFPILDTQPGLSVAEVYELLGALTDSQLARYRIMLIVDFLFPLAYAAFLIIALRSIARRKPVTMWFCRIGVFAAIIAAVLDYAENTLILIVLQSLPATVSAAAALGRITIFKWSAVGIAVLTTGVGLIRSVPRGGQ